MKPRWINAKGRRTRLRKRKAKLVPLWIVALIVIAMSSVSFAMAIHVIPDEHISLYSNRIVGSNFTLTAQATMFIGPNKILVTVELTNTQSSVQQANVTVYLLDSSGTGILNETQKTGDVAGSGTVTMFFWFHHSGITAQYASDFIQVTDIKV